MNTSLSPAGGEFRFLRSLFIGSKKEYKIIPIHQKRSINSKNWKTTGQKFVIQSFLNTLIFAAVAVHVTAVEVNSLLFGPEAFFFSQQIHNSHKIRLYVHPLLTAALV